MTLKPFKEMLALTKEGIDAALAPLRARQVKGQAELEEMITRMRADQKSGRLNLSPADQKGYQDFTTRMETAGKEIETIFVKGLVRLAGPLGELSDATAKLVDKFTDKALPDLIKDLSGGIEWLAKEVEKKSFVDAVEGFISAFGSMLGGLARFARWLGVADPVSGSAGGGAFGGTTPGTGGGGGTDSTRRAPNVTTGPARDRGGTGRASGGGTGVGSNAAAPSGSLQTRGLALMDRLIIEGWTPEAAALAAGNAQIESGIRTNPPGSNDNGTSIGILQMHGVRATAYRKFRAAHQDLTEFEAQTDFLNEDPRWARWKNIHSLDDAGAMSKAAEGYSTNTTGERAAASREWLNTYNKAHVSIHASPGGNTSLSSGAGAAGSP